MMRTPRPRSRPTARAGSAVPRLRQLTLASALAVALLAAGAGAAQGETTAGPTPSGESASTTAPTATTPTSSTPTSTTPAPEAAGGVHGQVNEPVGTEAPPAAASPSGGAERAETTATTTTPQVAGQRPQPTSTALAPAHRGAGRRTGAGKSAGSAPSAAAKQAPAPPPTSLTPPLPGALGAAIGGVPGFFIESFRVPPFLLPIYQAAGTAYDIPWQVLAAINEVETDYGRDLSVSSAGAEGWMQFLPSSWARYGVDATGAGYEDPYNPADAIFAAARYLQAAGGAQHIRAAVYAYNHSQAYVETVMLRAQLLAGTPPELLSAITGLTESRFPVHAPAHFGDGFPTVSGQADAGGAGAGAGGGPSATGAGQSVAGTVIYTQAGAPVIAVQDGQVIAMGDSPTLGHYVSLRDAYGNTYTYAQLGSLAALYPVLEPRVRGVSPRLAAHGSGASAHTSSPLVPASAGVQPHSPLSQAAVSSSLAMGAASGLETPPPAPAPPAAPPVLPAPSASVATPRVFRAGPDEVYLHSLRPGVQVLAGTVLGHVGAAGEAAGPLVDPAGTAEPHMLFQIRPAGAGAPLIDPKPILDGWVRLEATSVFRARGENPFLGTAPTAGQALLASKPQLEQLVLRDPTIHLPRCERGEVRAGEIDRRVLATLEYLAVSGVEPTVAAAGCAQRHSLDRSVPGAANSVGGAAGETLDLSAIDGTPIAGHEGPGSVTDLAVRRLLRLQGTMKPTRIVSADSYPGSDNTETLPGYRGLIHVVFASAPAAAAGTGPRARAAAVLAARSPLTPSQWLQLIAQIGEIPEPDVGSGPSAAAIPDPGTAAASAAQPGDGSAQPGGVAAQPGGVAAQPGGVAAQPGGVAAQLGGGSTQPSTGGGA
jgi:hypothetical protein